MNSASGATYLSKKAIAGYVKKREQLQQKKIGSSANNSDMIQPKSALQTNLSMINEQDKEQIREKSDVIMDKAE